MGFLQTASRLTKPFRTLRDLDIASGRTPPFAPEGLTDDSEYVPSPRDNEPAPLDSPRRQPPELASPETSQGEEDFGGNAPANIPTTSEADPREYQKRAIELAAQGAPQHPRHGKLRTIGEGLAKMYLGPAADELFDSDYAQQRRQYQHDLGAATQAAGLQRQLEADKLQDTYRQAQAEEMASRKEARENAPALKEEQGRVNRAKFSKDMAGEGWQVYEQPPDLETPSPQTVPGLPSGGTITAAAPKPKNLIDDPYQEGRQWIPQEKPRTGMTYLEPSEAKELELTGRTVNGKIEVPTSAYKQAITPIKPTATKNSVQEWIATVNNPQSTPEEIRAAKANLAEDERRAKARKASADHGVTMIGGDGKVYRLQPGDQIPTGAKTTSGVNSENTLTSATRSMVEVAPKVVGFVDRINELIDGQEKNLGPASSRWRDFWSGKVGANDPAYRRLNTDIGLLTTALMRMHVGARGGQQIMDHFNELIKLSRQDPDNLRASLDEIKRYALSMQHMQATGKAGEGAVAPHQAPPPGGGEAAPTVKTKAEFDALPSGAIYIGEGGKKYKKP